VGVQDDRWIKGGIVRAVDYNFFMEKETKIMNWEQDFLYNTEYYQQLRAEFISVRMSYVDMRDRWCNIIVLNMHVPSEEKRDD
jgi:hypothetical protein